MSRKKYTAKMPYFGPVRVLGVSIEITVRKVSTDDEDEEMFQATCFYELVGLASWTFYRDRPSEAIQDLRRRAAVAYAPVIKKKAELDRLARWNAGAPKGQKP